MTDERLVISVVYTFPLAQRIARATEDDLRECALGYRARNLLVTARLVSSGKADLEAWSALPDADLREKLCALPGVGAKVANCVMLFAYERLRAFPIDVWIERVLKQQYFPRKKKVTTLRAARIFAKHILANMAVTRSNICFIMRGWLAEVRYIKRFLELPGAHAGAEAEQVERDPSRMTRSRASRRDGLYSSLESGSTPPLRGSSLGTMPSRKLSAL